MCGCVCVCACVCACVIIWATRPRAHAAAAQWRQAQRRHCVRRRCCGAASLRHPLCNLHQHCMASPRLNGQFALMPHSNTTLYTHTDPRQLMSLTCRQHSAGEHNEGVDAHPRLRQRPNAPAGVQAQHLCLGPVAHALCHVRQHTVLVRHHLHPTYHGKE
jgi:hypothetical protein